MAASSCPTWLQTCLFQTDDTPPSEAESHAYLGFIEEMLRGGVIIEGVLLYGIARPSLQPEAPRLTTISQEWMEAFSAKIRLLGLAVRLNP